MVGDGNLDLGRALEMLTKPDEIKIFFEGYVDRFREENTRNGIFTSAELSARHEIRRILDGYGEDVRQRWSPYA